MSVQIHKLFFPLGELRNALPRNTIFWDSALRCWVRGSRHFEGTCSPLSSRLLNLHESLQLVSSDNGYRCLLCSGDRRTSTVRCQFFEKDRGALYIIRYRYTIIFYSHLFLCLREKHISYICMLFRCVWRVTTTNISMLLLLLQYFILTDSEMWLQIERFANLSTLLVLFSPRLLCEPLIIPGGLNWYRFIKSV